ncbi:MAG: hypothetical protein PGN24_05385 [Microbacterium arborescens]
MSDPDLPSNLVPGRLERHGELMEARVELGSGTVDGAHARLAESVVAPTALERLDLVGSILADVRFDDIAAAELLARDASWRTVLIAAGRIGTLDAARGRWDGVVLRGLRIDYLSVSGATVRDVVIADCRIGTLDAPGAQLERVRFENTTVDEFDTRAMTSSDLDLRGLEALAFTDVRALRDVTLSLRQAEAHAAALAGALGIDVRDDAPGAS